MRDAGAAFEATLRHLRVELGDARRAPRAAQFAVLVDGHAARVVAAVLEPLESLDEDRNDVAGADCADDATHAELLGAA
jgi:hypothetical protein